jgi:DMSO/TMAO reductase YedYZ molybdopterin-dependent catalytic subunit
MYDPRWLAEHRRLSRRYFLQAGVAATTLAGVRPATTAEEPKPAAKPTASATGSSPAKSATTKPDDAKPKKTAKAGAFGDPYFTPTAEFHDVSRGTPLPHSLPDDKKREIGLTRETWKLEVIGDPENKPRLGNPLTKEKNTALDFAGLVKLGETKAVRFAKVMTCLNLGCPLGMGIWEGVPLRDVLWLAEPREDVRRVFYYGYHNDDPKQLFRSSLPLGRVLEDPADLPPVILCYKLNGQWLDSERGGPVRVVVPEAYGFKSIKWLTHVVLSNLWYANDTYGEKNNDVDSPMKSFAAVLEAPREVKAGEKIPVSGYAQVGVSGVKKVQVSIERRDAPRPTGDPYFTKAPWIDAEILGPPKQWGALPDGKVPDGTLGFDGAGKPKTWPMKLAKIHWATVLPALPAGDYELRSRTIDDQGYGQPMPRPFRKSGNSQIETVQVKVVG